MPRNIPNPPSTAPVILLTLLISAGVSTYSIHIPQTVAYIGVLLVYVSLPVYLLSGSGLLPNRQLRIKTGPHLWFLGIFILLFILTSILYPIQVVALRVPVFIAIAIANLVVVPATIDRNHTFYALTLVSTVVVVVALPGAVLSEFTLFGLDMELNSLRQNYPFTPEFRPISGLLSNQNLLGFFATLSAIWSLHMSRIDPRFHLFWLINGIGTFLTGSRAAVLALLIGVVIIFLGRVDVRYSSLFAWFTLSGILTLIMMLVGIIPTLPGVSQIEFSSRKIIWTNALALIRSQPVVGYGPGQATILQTSSLPEGFNVPFDNSFLRSFAMTGIVGGLAYVSIFIIALRNSKSRPLLLALLMASIIFQLFQSHTLFGLEGRSLITAMILGYVFIDRIPASVNSEVHGNR